MATTQRAFRLHKVACPRCGATMAIKTLASQHVCRDLRAPRKKHQRAAPVESDVLQARAREGAVRSFEKRLGRLGLPVAAFPVDGIPLGESTSDSNSESCEECVDCGPACAAFKSKEFAYLPQER